MWQGTVKRQSKQAVQYVTGGSNKAVQYVAGGSNKAVQYVTGGRNKAVCGRGQYQSNMCKGVVTIKEFILVMFVIIVTTVKLRTKPNKNLYSQVMAKKIYWIQIPIHIQAVKIQIHIPGFEAKKNHCTKRGYLR